MTADTLPPPPDETAEIEEYEARYAQDPLGFVRWLNKGNLTREARVAKTLLEKER